MLEQVQAPAAGTSVVLATIPLVDNANIGINALVVGRQATGLSAFRQTFAIIKMDAGVASIVSQSDINRGFDFAVEPTLLWTISGTNAVLTATSVLSTTWRADFGSVRNP